MKKTSSLLLFLLITIACCNSQYYVGETFRLKFDDDSSNVNFLVDTTAWDTDFENWDDKQEIFWERLETTITNDHFHENLGILIASMSTYEAYWDGKYLGSNAKNKTVPFVDSRGNYWENFLLPDSLSSKGEHVLTLRHIREENDNSFHSYFLIGSYEDLIEDPLRKSMFMFFIGGVFITAFLYFLFLYIFENRNLVYLIFSIICILFTGLICFEYLKFFIDYPYPFQRTRLIYIEYFHIALTLSIPAFLIVLFRLRYKEYLISGLFLLVAIIFLFTKFNFEYGFDKTARILNFTAITCSIALSAIAFSLKRKGSVLMFGIFSTIMIFTFFNPLDDTMHFVSNFDVAIFLSFCLMIIGMLIVLSLSHREQRKQYELSIVTSERLKNELLKKNIKPHFIMNTLTSLIDWVEESPEQGVKFIHALAEEFDVLNDISDYSLVPIGQEIKLCKKHLEIMQFRKEIEYIWTEKDIDYNEILPPAIIHTAVENGITHCKPDEEGKMKFHLEFYKEKNCKKYTLYTYGMSEKPIDKIIDGTGTSYIKARLQESYEDQWKYESSWMEYGWKVEITIAS